MDAMAVIAAFGGGVLGAAMGAVPVFILTGLLAILGVAAAAGGGSELIQVAFGPVLGPHVSFGGGVAAAAYAGSRGVLKSGRDIASALMGLGRMDVLIVGGVFGAAGYALHWLLTASGVANWTDAVALSVVVSNMAARLIFGTTGPFGSVSVPEGRRFRPDDSASWLPWQQEWSHVLVIGAGVGLAAAYLTARSGLGTGKEVLGSGISTVILTFLVMGSKVTGHSSHLDARRAWRRPRRRRGGGRPLRGRRRVSRRGRLARFPDSRRHPHRPTGRGDCRSRRLVAADEGRRHRPASPVSKA